MADLDLRDAQSNNMEVAKGTGKSLHVDASPYIIAITTSNVTTYDPPLTGIRVGGSGNVTIESNGITFEVAGLLAGETLVGSITKVTTASTATAIIGWQRTGA